VTCAYAALFLPCCFRSTLDSSLRCLPGLAAGSWWEQRDPNSGRLQVCVRACLCAYVPQAWANAPDGLCTLQITPRPSEPELDSRTLRVFKSKWSTCKARRSHTRQPGQRKSCKEYMGHECVARARQHAPACGMHERRPAQVAVHLKRATLVDVTGHTVVKQLHPFNIQH